MQSIISVEVKGPKDIYYEKVDALTDESLKEALSNLYEFGFTNFELNKELMVKHRNINIVAEQLSSQLDFQEVNVQEPAQYGQVAQAVQNFEEFLERFEILFKKTISDEDKEESDFADEYASLLEVLKDFVHRNINSANWSNIFLQMQGEIAAFKKPLRTLNNKGQCWKYVREIQMICAGEK